MKIPLSNRLLACCGFVRPGDRVADIGCDHGYLGIHLLKTGIANRIIAADVNEGPLQSAMRNGLKFGVRDKMTFFLSDGLRNVPRDFDTLVCAGMGADTMISILEAAPWLKDGRYRLILQCQSRRPELRRYLYEQGFRILRETLAQDGKFLYPVMEVGYEPAEPLTPGGYHISPALLASGSSLLGAFYERVKDALETTVNGLRHSGSEKLPEFEAILKEIQEMETLIYGERG
ncbi:MAG: SAM-dependent methyltransferase [Oscillospiraceae bacterium]|nr:SAM-dependent methyltransferase [Oscillospiraceae bacterium]